MLHDKKYNGMLQNETKHPALYQIYQIIKKKMFLEKVFSHVN